MATQHESFRRSGSLSSLSPPRNWRQLWQHTVAHCCSCCPGKYQLLPPPTVTTRPAAADSTTCKTAFRRLALQCPLRRRSSDLAFSQNFLAGVADRSCISLCFLAIRFHALVVILTSNLPLLVLTGPSWALLCFWGVLGFLGPRVSRVPFSAVPSLLRAVSHARAAAVRPRLRAMCCEAATLTAPPSSPAASYGRRCHHVSSFTNASHLSENYN